MKNQEVYRKKFIEKAIKKFGNRYDYSLGDYQGTRKLFKIVCPVHGEIMVLPETHLRSKTGCPKCDRHNRAKLIDGKNRKDMREYRIWKAMRVRVNDPNYKSAEYYSKKGISICDRWNSFENFYKDMGKCPEGYSIDRIDPNGNYCPENCRWAGAEQQSQNRGDFNKVFTYNGETHVLKEWSRILNIKYTTLYQRLYRSHMSFEEAITPPKHKFPEFTYNNETHDLREWCSIKNMEYSVVYNRIFKHKWPFEEAINTPKGERRIKI